MDKKDIPTDILSQHPEATCFKDDYFLFDSHKRPAQGHSFKIETYGFFLCTQGAASGMIDLMPFQLKRGTLIVNVPDNLSPISPPVMISVEPPLS